MPVLVQLECYFCGFICSTGNPYLFCHRLQNWYPACTHHAVQASQPCHPNMPRLSLPLPI